MEERMEPQKYFALERGETGSRREQLVDVKGGPGSAVTDPRPRGRGRPGEGQGR